MVLEVESQEVCQTGFEEEAELQWKEDKVAALAPCGEIKHVFARTARDCPEVKFLSLEVRASKGLGSGLGLYAFRIFIARR